MRTFLSPFLFLLFFFLINKASSFDFPDRLTKSLRRKPSSRKPQEYFELGLPLPSDSLTPSCTHPILRHSFANTINGPPFSVPYSPPADCPSPAAWSSVAVEFRARCRGEQYDRISALWLGGVEILRTSTAEPTKSGVFWKVRKDVTRFASVLARSDLNLTVMLENVVDDEFTGVYHVEIDLLFYNQTLAPNKIKDIKTLVDDEFGFGATKLEEKLGEMYNKPADLIIPISESSGERGFWFRAESEMDLQTKEIRFPNNTRRAVLELCVSFHGDDEFWYSNPPNSYIAINNLETGRGNGAHREVFATVDGELAGAEVPFPVVFTGGVNPLFWEPVVAIGAFQLPSYDVELTPFLGKVLDGKAHAIGIGVADGISYWLVNANLHLWLDRETASVEAKSSFNPSPVMRIERGSQIRKLDGSFKIKAERTIRYKGWVKWSGGNYTTSLSQHYKVKSMIRFSNGGAHKSVEQDVKATRELLVWNERGQEVWQVSSKRSFPMRVVTSRLAGAREDQYVLVTNVSHSVNEKSLGGGRGRIKFSNGQDCGGWMEVKGHSVVAGGAETRQSLSYSGSDGCYLLSVLARNGKIVANDTSSQCLSLSSS